MATVYNETTDTITELDMRSDSGIELMSDILSNYGITYKVFDGQRVYQMDSDSIEWWQTWIQREERIAEAFADCEDEDTIAAYWKAVDENQDNLERMQDELERILGIGDEPASRWQRKGNWDNWVRDDGSWLEYGAFGRDTYGLHYVGDPDVVYKVYSPLSIDVPKDYSTLADAERIIRDIEEGRL